MDSLPAFTFAAEDQRFAIFVQLDRCGTSIIVTEVTLAAYVHRACQPQAGIRLPVGALRFPIDHLLRHIETLLQLAAGDPVAVRRNVPGFGRIDTGDFDGIYAKLMSAQIDRLLDCPFG